MGSRMNKQQMQQLHGAGRCHDCAPKPWRDVPNLVGDYDLDATILHRDNPALPARLDLYTKHGGNAYKPVTAYNGYSNYGGDS